MMTRGFMTSGRETFRPLRSRRGLALGLNPSMNAEAIQRNLMMNAPVPNWAIYAGSTLLVAGGVLGLMRDEKSVFSVALGASMIGVGGYLFFQTLKQG